MLYTFLPLMDSGIKGKSFFVCGVVDFALLFSFSPKL